MNLTTKLALIIIFGLIVGKESYGQGLNNEYPLDSTDLKTCFEIMGMNVFKFPVRFDDSCSMDIIIDEYKNDTLYKSDSYMAGVEAYPEKFRDAFTLKVDDTVEWFRVYWYEENDTHFLCRMNYGNMSLDDYFEVEDLTVGYRAYDSCDLAINEKKPLVIMYGKKETEEFEHCPGDRMPEDVAKLYDYVVAISVKLIKKE